jgi:type III restriction enzyme
MKTAGNTIANRLSLRSPQRESLEILDRVCDLLPLSKDQDAAQALSAIRAEFPNVTDFERDFPSLCFALATGVGKTRLMGAFIAYLHQAEGIRHFFVLAPNLTIYNKLIADFTLGSPKYVFQGLSDFIIQPPEIITGDNYESGRGVRSERLIQPAIPGFKDPDAPVHINIFNISKINIGDREEAGPRIKRLKEYIGESYFEYLSELDDLVLLMDESHRYRGKAGWRAINELKPILGLELTATPRTETAGGGDFKNVIYSYPLSSALRDGFVKEPAVATRENFRADNYDEAGLEKLKLEDGVRIHEHTKVQLDIYARENLKPLVKPFMLVVAKDTNHANDLLKRIEADDFFGGRYKGRVITVHSNQTGEEKDETVQQLLSVEDPANPTEIVIHVNMLKEGWDVTNLYTIVPLRAANSRTLVEQSIGRGLRLPYGKRTGVPDVDRLTIVSHDRFQEIVDHANDPNSIIRTGVVIGRDIPDAPTKAVTIQPVFMTQLGLAIPPATSSAGTSPAGPAPTITEPERKTAELTMQVIRQQFERLARSGDLRTADVQRRITSRVTELMQPVQGELPGVTQPVDVASVVDRVTSAIAERTIDIPKIIVTPKGEVTVGYQDFDLDCSSFRQPPAEKDLLVQHLMNNQRFKIVSGDGVVVEKNLEDYIVRGLIDKDDINYDEQAELLYKLATQMVRHLQSYLQTPDDVLNVLQFYQAQIVTLIHTQMNQHYVEKATEYEVTVSKGFQTLTSSMAAMQTDQEILPFRAPVEERLLIKGMVFGGFAKCLYPAQKFDSDTERRFAIILEDETSVLKWLKPPKDVLRIYYHQDEVYQPDFVVETTEARYLCEPKRASEMTDEVVQLKAKAATIWCQYATSVSDKPWYYVLIPHDAIDASATFSSLVRRYRFQATHSN